MILMIDNYDSFTFNLVQYFEELGEDVEVRKNDSLGIADVEKMIPEAIVISPGPGKPEEAGISIQLVRAFAGRIPILGVCLGHQSIARAFEGRVSVNWRMMHGKVSPIFHDNRTVFKGLTKPFTATRYHSLVVEEEYLPACLEVSARSERGEIMGIRHRYFPIEGVQFHPESIMTAEGKTLLQNFLNIKKQWNIKCSRTTA